MSGDFESVTRDERATLREVAVEQGAAISLVRSRILRALYTFKAEVCIERGWIKRDRSALGTDETTHVHVAMWGFAECGDDTNWKELWVAKGLHPESWHVHYFTEEALA